MVGGRRMTRKQNKFEKSLFLATAGILLLILVALPLAAKKIPADQVRITTPVYVPTDSFKPLPGRYSYSVSWKGIPAGDVELEIDRDAVDYTIHASAQTNKVIDFFYRLRYESETILEADTLRPKHSISVALTNAKKKMTELEFLPNGEIQSKREDHRGRLKTFTFDPDNFTLDPYSAGFLALSQEWKVGDTRRFDLFSGKSRYLIEFTAVEQTELTVNGKERSAIVLSPTVRKLTDTDHDSEDKKMRDVRIYISADQPREILKMSSDLLIGSIDTEMVDFAPAPKTETSEKIGAIAAKNQAL